MSAGKAAEARCAESRAPCAQPAAVLSPAAVTVAGATHGAP